jgi:acyl-CoA thioesterase FadM
MAYEIRCGDALVSTAATEHAVVDVEGRLRRIPRERREELGALAGP